MNIEHLIHAIKDTVDSHRISEGKYARWLWQNEKGNRELGINAYGCADSANILYSIGSFIRDPQQRSQWITTLQEMQDPQTGLFTEETHHTIHTTAHCIAALELFDAAPRYPLNGLEKYFTKDGLYTLLDGLNWLGTPWPQSHQGAGVYAACVLTSSVPLQWQDWYFDWLYQNTDAKYGMSKSGTVDSGTAPIAHHLFGWFHYIFNHEYARRPMRYPEKLLDTCIDLYKNNALLPRFGKMVGFMEIDWVFCMNRATRQTPHRFWECKELLSQFTDGYIEYLTTLNKETDDEFNDLHMLFGTVCALAELQQALPGKIETAVPLKNVLDRRPFI